ncbi:MAG: hypothetical protein ACI80V_003136 [Rhodothermales bacterium]|jgi:hypothetical protein
MKYLSLVVLFLCLAGCDANGSSDDSADETRLFGRWQTSTRSFSGLIVSAPASSGHGRTEMEYKFSMRHVLALDQRDDTVELSHQQVLSGPQTLYSYNLDGTLSLRNTSDLVSSAAGLWDHTYSGAIPLDSSDFTLENEDGREVRIIIAEGRLRMEFSGYYGLFNPFVRTFYDYSGGSASKTPLLEHFEASPYVLEFDYP